MKSKLLYLMVFALATVSLASCDDESTAGLTRITYYPELTMEGPATVYVDKGTTFTDPGYSAILDGEDVTDQVQVNSNVNMAASGVYSISYAVTNDDGFSSTASRTVVVTDPNDPIEGIYDTDPNSYRSYNGVTPYGASYVILIFNNGDGTYTLQDMLGGWYWYRANYGTDYALEGIISVPGDGTFTLISSFLIGWGDEANYMANGRHDAATGTFSWQLNYTDYSMDFFVTMTKR